MVAIPWASEDIFARDVSGALLLSFLWQYIEQFRDRQAELKHVILKGQQHSRILPSFNSLHHSRFSGNKNSSWSSSAGSRIILISNHSGENRVCRRFHCPLCSWQRSDPFRLVKYRRSVSPLQSYSSGYSIRQTLMPFTSKICSFVYSIITILQYP